MSVGADPETNHWLKSEDGTMGSSLSQEVVAIEAEQRCQRCLFSSVVFFSAYHPKCQTKCHSNLRLHIRLSRVAETQ